MYLQFVNKYTSMRTHWVIFSDLDGTFIDHETYSYEAALPAFRLTQERGVPLVFVSSKTRAEIELLIQRLGINEPFISENGGAIFVPRDYFEFDFEWDLEVGPYQVIELGTPYPRLRDALIEARNNSNCPAVGFGDMSPEDVSLDTGLDIESAILAKKREYDEAFRLECPPDRAQGFFEGLLKKGLTVTRGGRYYHVMGENDKGRAVHILSGIYRRRWPNLRTIGLGDSLNDEPMLRAVDQPILVQKPGEIYDKDVDFEGLMRAGGVGPEGWNLAVKKILSEVVHE